ncbi:acyl-[acyl-carrier-protein]--UDP-N-acetylglucosamine O-acyltransferase, partial [Gammaproteobacteria bacterium]|nr:acyl-[acyl-carrier-protein]--UDP-N-acetylglucosamine O-acyltransferase [Gammaproteobacteria bacterium]
MNSVIDPSANIHESVKIGPFCMIGPNVTIGPNCILHSHVVIKGRTTIDEDNIFYQFSTIGEDTPDKKYAGEDTSL